ncbi:MAG TPA: helix-turn-helix transcriptional regulator [Humisphaera sp.]
MTETLAVEDVRAIVRLLGEVAEMAPTPADPAARKRHLLTGLAAMVGADVWLWHQGRGMPPKESPMLFAELHGGYDSDEQRTHHLLALTDPEFDARCQQRIGDHCAWDAAPHVTRTRRQFVDDTVWYAGTEYARRLCQAGLDDCMLAMYLLAPDAWSGIGLWRRAGRDPFSARDRCIVHVVTSEVDWLHREGTDVPAADHVVSLPPRLRQVLLLTLAGHGRKEIAAKLDLSPHTIGDYHKALHKHFGVRSRVELMRQFMSGGGVKPVDPLP